MSTDLRESLKRAALEPNDPLEIGSVYRRGRRIRRWRQVGTTAAVLVVVAVGVLVAGRLRSGPAAPYVEESRSSQSEFLADGHLSFREYRIAAAEAASCLERSGQDPTVRFDETSGRLVFGIPEGSPEFVTCRSAYLDDAESVWIAQTGPEADGVSWAQYRQAVQDTVRCVRSEGGEAQATLDVDSGPHYGISVQTEPEGQDAEAVANLCNGRTGLAGIQRRWADQVGPSNTEDRSFYELIARCLRDAGIDIKQATPDQLSEAIRTDSELYDECWDKAHREYRPYR